MNTRAKTLQFDKKMAEQIFVRDEYSCLFCKKDYKMPANTNIVELKIMDPMHFIPKSHGGLGIRKNGGCGCRYHHNMYDHSRSREAHEEMQAIFTEYLKEVEPGWNKDDLIYTKQLQEAYKAQKKAKKKKEMQLDIFGGEIEINKIERPKYKRLTMKEKFRNTYGYVHGYKCKNCIHFIANRYNNRNIYKCQKLGVTNSIATDIKKSEIACKCYREE